MNVNPDQIRFYRTLAKLPNAIEDDRIKEILDGADGLSERDIIDILKEEFGDNA